jgi:hypothetical protein
MSGSYSVGFLSAGAGPGAAYAILQNTDVANGRRIRVHEVGFTSIANTQLPIALGYIVPGGLGMPSGSPLVGVPDDDLDNQTPLGNVVTTWSSAATTPTKFYRRFFGTATSGAGYIWSFPKPKIVSPTAGIALWNPDGSLTGPQVTAWFAWSE